MKARLAITPISNIDYATYSLRDWRAVTSVEHDWETEVKVFDVEKNEIGSVPIKQISLYQHRLIIDDKQHHIIYMYSYMPKHVKIAPYNVQ